MSDYARLTPAEVAQTSANLRLAAQFVRELIEAPEWHEALADGATLVLLPGDEQADPQLSQDNMKMAIDIANEGGRITTWVVGMPVTTGPKTLLR